MFHQVFVLAFASFAAADVADLRGADAVLKQIAEQAPKPAQPEVSNQKPKTSVEQFSADVEAFAATVATLPKDQAVAGWLQLVDRLNELQNSQAQTGGYGVPRGLALLVTALPGPEAWPALAAAIDARPLGDRNNSVREHSLRMLARLLTIDEPGEWKELAEIEKLLTGSGSDAASRFAFSLDQLAQ